MHFDATGNATVLQTAKTVLNESTSPFNGSTFGGIKVDPTQTFLGGMKASSNLHHYERNYLTFDQFPPNFVCFATYATGRI